MSVTNKKFVKVVVEPSIIPPFPSSMAKYIEFLENLMRKVPEEYRSMVVVNSNPWDSRGDNYPSIEVYYIREETDNEFHDRLNRKQAIVSEVEILEREQLRILQEKYGG